MEEEIEYPYDDAAYLDAELEEKATMDPIRTALLLEDEIKGLREHNQVLILTCHYIATNAPDLFDEASDWADKEINEESLPEDYDS